MPITFEATAVCDVCEEKFSTGANETCIEDALGHLYDSAWRKGWRFIGSGDSKQILCPECTTITQQVHDAASSVNPPVQP